MRVVNEVRSTPLGEARDGEIEGVVRVRGFEAEAGGRSIAYLRHEPESVVVRGEDSVRRLSLARDANHLPAIALPVAMYIAARVVLKRRRGR